MRYLNALEVDSVCGQALIPPRPPWRFMREPNDFRGHMTGSEGRRHGNQTNQPNQTIKTLNHQPVGLAGSIRRPNHLYSIVDKRALYSRPSPPLLSSPATPYLSQERARPETH